MFYKHNKLNLCMHLLISASDGSVVYSSYGTSQILLAKDLEIVWSVKKPVEGNFPSNVSQYPCIERIEGFTIYFDNGACKKVEKIILCTGSNSYLFPFLDDSCEFSVVNHKKIWPLYKNTFNAHYPTMEFLAMISMKPLTFIYRIAGYFRGGKFSRISRIKNNS